MRIRSQITFLMTVLLMLDLMMGKISFTLFMLLLPISFALIMYAEVFEDRY